MTQNDRGLPETSVDEGTLAILDDTYVYDDNGNVRQIVDGLPGAPGSRTMTYDGLDRLLTVTAGSTQGGNAVFSYDVLDNITRLDQGARTIRHQYAAATNRLASVRNAAGSTLFTVAHDARGNQTTRTTGALVDTFTFDKANRLTASNVGGVAATYRYDGLGRRMQHVEAAVPSYFQYSQAGQLLFSQDGTNRFNHIHLAGSLVAKRVVPYGGGPATTRYQHTDALGSPVAETDEVGALIGRERMTAYGEPADGTWKDGPGFTGHDMDPASRLVYMQQRYYDPVVGRFLSVDPMALDTNSAWNFNRYNYAANSPYRFKDPDGRSAAHFVKEKAIQLATKVAVAAAETVAEEVGKTVDRAKDYVRSRDLTLSAGVSGVAGNHASKTHAMAPSVQVGGSLKVTFNASRGQFALQFSGGPMVGQGGGAIVSSEVSAGLIEGPLLTGLSVQNQAHATLNAPEIPIRGGASASWDSSGGNVGIGVRPIQAGVFVGYGVGGAITYTATTPPLWGD